MNQQIVKQNANDLKEWYKSLNKATAPKFKEKLSSKLGVSKKVVHNYIHGHTIIPKMAYDIIKQVTGVELKDYSDEASN